MGRGDPRVPVVEGWTILAMAAGATTQATVGPFVLNVMNRHPAVVARMASTLQIASGGRLVLGIGIGGAPHEHAAYGIDFPEAPERVARLEEAVAVIRALWTGGPVTRPSPYYPLTRRRGLPHPDAATDRSSSAARRRRGAAGRADRGRLERLRRQLREPTCRSTSRPWPRPGGEREDQRVHRRVPGRLAERRADRRQPVGPGAARDLGALAGGRRRRGDRAGPDDRGCRRAGGRHRPLVSGRAAAWVRSPGSVAPSPA